MHAELTPFRLCRDTIMRVPQAVFLCCAAALLCPAICPAAQSPWDQLYWSAALSAGFEARPAIPHGAHFRIDNQDLETPRHGPPSSMDRFAEVRLDLSSREVIEGHVIAPFRARLTLAHDQEALSAYHYNGQDARIAIDTTCFSVAAAIADQEEDMHFDLAIGRIEYREVEFTVHAGGRRFADRMKFIGFQPFVIQIEHTFGQASSGPRPVLGLKVDGGWGWGHSNSDPMTYNGGAVGLNLGLLSAQAHWRIDFTCSVASRFCNGHPPAPGDQTAASSISELSYTGFGLRLGCSV